MAKKLGVLHVYVMEGRNLIPMDSDGQSDPYCVVLVGDKKKRTKAVRHNLNPRWENEHYEFSIDKSIHNLTVEIYDWDRFSADDRMGMAVVPIKNAMEMTLDTIQWYPLVPIKSEDKVSGDLRLKIRFEKEKAEAEKKPLIKAIKSQDITAIENILSKSKSDISVCDSEGTPAIHLAATTNNIQLLMTMLKSTSLYVSTPDSHGNSPLHIFAQKCLVLQNDEPITKLIERGCSINNENSIGEIPLHKACLASYHKTIMLEILISKGSNINHLTKTKETPLHYAIKMGRLEFVRLLLQKGSDFSIEGGLPPKKPLDLAIELGHTHIVNRIKQTQEVCNWLQGLQLDSLIPIFTQNDLFMDVVADIDESTLDSLKINVSGQRAKLLKAVRRLKNAELVSSNSSSNLSLTISSENCLDQSQQNIYVQQQQQQQSLTESAQLRKSSSTTTPVTSTTVTDTTTVITTSTSSMTLPVSSTPSATTTTSTTTTTSLSTSTSASSSSTTTTTTNQQNNDTIEPLQIPESKEKPNLEYSELAHLKHTHLEDTSWVIDESQVIFTQLLGVGASGKVYKGTYKGAEVAIKVLKSSTDPKDIQEFKKEFQIVSSLKSPGVVYFYGAGIKDKLCIVMEYCSRGSLYHILKDESVQFTWANFFHLALQAVNSLNSLHTWSPQILHRDLKSLNLLVTENWTVKICDFGLSRFDTGSNLATLGKLRGTYAYCAPEVYFGNKYTTKSDVYSIGMILWEMVHRCLIGTHLFPFGEYANLKFDYQILIASAKKDVRPTFPANTPAKLSEIIAKCFVKEASERPNTQELYDELVAIRNKEYLPNRNEWESKRKIPEQQLKSEKTIVDTVALQPTSPIINKTMEEKFNKPAIPQHLTRSRSNSSPIEPNGIVKKHSQLSLLKD